MNFRVPYGSREILNVLHCFTLCISRPLYGPQKFILRSEDKKNIIINSKEMVMEIDTDVYATILSEKVKNESFKELELSTTRHFLEDYVENVLNPVGSLENLRVTLNNKTLKLGCLYYQVEDHRLSGDSGWQHSVYDL